jgi:hypothetical protein
MSSPSTVALRITSKLYSFSDPTVPEQFSNQLSKSIEVRRQQSRYYGNQLKLVYIVAWQLKVRPSIIVAYLRKPHIWNIAPSLRMFVRSSPQVRRKVLTARMGVSVGSSPQEVWLEEFYRSESSETVRVGRIRVFEEFRTVFKCSVSYWLFGVQ